MTTMKDAEEIKVLGALTSGTTYRYEWYQSTDFPRARNFDNVFEIEVANASPASISGDVGGKPFRVAPRSSPSFTIPRGVQGINLKPASDIATDKVQLLLKGRIREAPR